jgi:hypothetical protein
MEHAVTVTQCKIHYTQINILHFQDTGAQGIYCIVVGTLYQILQSLTAQHTKLCRGYFYLVK